MTEEVAKIKANKDGSYIDIVPEKCVSAQKAQYDENGHDLLDAESSQTIKGANTFAAKQTFTGGVAVSGTSAIAGNVNMDSGDVAIGAKVTASNTSNTIKVANHDSALISNDVLSAKDINEVNGSANNLLHRSGAVEPISKTVQIQGYPGQIDLFGMSADAVNPSGDVICGRLNCCDKNGKVLFELIGVVGSKGEGYVNISVRNSDGSMKTQRLITGD